MTKSAIKLSALMIFTVACMACGNKKEMSSATTAEQGQPVKGETEADDSKGDVEVQPVVVDPSYRPRQTDAYTLLSLEMNDDVMLVTVQYSGGCEPHEFEMKTNGIWLKSMPPQLHVTLEHNSNKDQCRSVLTKTYAFDVAPLQYKGSKQVRLKVNGDKGQEVLYSY